MNHAQGFPVKKAFLYALIVSVAVSALLGILAIGSGQFGWVQLRILLTTATIAASSICGLSCGAYLSTKRGLALPLTGVALTLLAAGMVIAGLWNGTLSVGYWQVAASASVFSVACAHLSLLSMARLAQWFRWSLLVAYLAIFGVASMIVLLIMGQTGGLGMFQLLAAAAIFDAAITIVIPVLHKLSKSDTHVADVGTTLAAPRNIDAEMAALQQRMAELERLKRP